MAYKPKRIKSVDPITPGCNKKIYNSLGEAEEMIQYIKESRNVRELHAYQCPTCGMWHLTSTSKH